MGTTRNTTASTTNIDAAYRRATFPPMATDERAGAADGAHELPRGPRELLRRAMPTTALGLAFALFCASVASAFTGAVLYAYYEYRLGQTEDRVDEFEAKFEDDVNAAL